MRRGVVGGFTTITVAIDAAALGGGGREGRGTHSAPFPEEADPDEPLIAVVVT